MTRLLLVATAGFGLWFVAGLLVALTLGPRMARHAERYPAAVETPTAPPQCGVSTGTGWTRRQPFAVAEPGTSRFLN